MEMWYYIGEEIVPLVFILLMLWILTRSKWWNE